MAKRGFASDNNAGVHPAILEAMASANQGHAIAYGDDPLTEKTTMRMKEIFGMESEIFFVFIGTAANVLGINAATQSHHAVICPQTAHINVDECGAPEKFTGCKLLPVASPDGKLTVDDVKTQMQGIGFEHHVQPGSFPLPRQVNWERFIPWMRSGIFACTLMKIICLCTWTEPALPMRPLPWILDFMRCQVGLEWICFPSGGPKTE